MANLHLLLLVLSLVLVEGYPQRFRRDAETTHGKKRGDIEIEVVENRPGGKRKEKALEYYSESYLDNPPAIFDSAVGPEFIDFDDELAAALIAYEGQPPAEEEDNEILSRTRPSRPKGNSPIYYIRLPPTPYMFIPGMGYVSNPPSLRPPPVVQTESQLINLPITFASNGKPTGVYIWNPPPSRPATTASSGYYSRPKPPLKDSVITTLDKGPYIFNGRPSDIFLLRNAYNTLYADALQNFYP